MATLRMYLKIKNVTLLNIAVDANMLQKFELDWLVMLNYCELPRITPLRNS